MTEYLLHTLQCNRCGKRTRASLPIGIDGHALGPRATALVVLLTGHYRLSRRSTCAVLAELFDVPLSLGALKGCEEQLSRALAGPTGDIQRAIEHAPVLHVDETGWGFNGRMYWLYVAATPTMATFEIRAHRDRVSFQKLVGGFDGVLVTDRAKTYASWPAHRHQICWAHLRRDFIWLSEKSRSAGVYGSKLQHEQELLFREWRRARDRPSDRSRFVRQALRRRRAMLHWLERGARLHRPMEARFFCEELLEVFDQAWTFVRVAGVEPTNNHAERCLRTAVLWRKVSFGTRSEAGCRYVERVLSATHTLRLQQRNVLNYLTELITADRMGVQLPSLLPAIGPSLQAAA